MSTTPPLAVVESSLPNAGKRRRGERATRIRGSRPGFWVYLTLVVVFVSAAFPLYWSFVIGSGDASSLRERPWWPGGNFLDNAFAVVSNPAVNFWPALWNSIYSSFLIAAAVVITLWRNQLDETRRYAHAALRQPDTSRRTLEGLDPRTISMAHLSWAHWRAGHIGEALTASRQSVKMARTHGSPDTLGFALAFAGLLHRFLGNVDIAGRYARELRLHAGRYELALWQGIADMLLAWQRAREGGMDSLPRLRACVRGILRVMPGVAVMFFHTLAEACGLLGRHDEQLRAIEQGLEAARRVHEGFFSSMLEQMRFECLAHRTPR